MKELNSNPPEMTFQEIFNSALIPVMNRLEQLETSHRDLQQGLENFLKELTALLNSKKPSALQELLKSLIVTLETVSSQSLSQKDSQNLLNSSIENLQQTLDQKMLDL